jgi:hypothetical protein
MTLTAQVPTCTDGHIQARCAPEQAPQACMIGMASSMRFVLLLLELSLLESLPEQFLLRRAASSSSSEEA